MPGVKDRLKRKLPTLGLSKRIRLANRSSELSSSTNMLEPPEPRVLFEAPIQSPNDKREYRIIQLDNGLRALLIADVIAQTLNDNDDDAEEMDEGEESGSESEEDDDEDDDEDEMNTSEDDKEESKKSKPEEKLAAAGLCIGVGSFSDPVDIPGLAHFLEHMVFMGSEKYPAENSFDAFIKRCGGNDNAETDCETTVFYFDVHTKHFRQALDHFAQFFICPLLKADSMQREMESVDSEFQMNLTSDTYRKQQLRGSLVKDGHPMSKFMWGNLATLKTGISEKGIDLHARLKEFWKTYYTAQYMTLAVQSRESLDTLESWVREIFSKVPNNGLPPVTFNHLCKPFDTPSFYKMYKVIPVRNIHQVELMWALPSLKQHYKVKPHCYLSWLLGHEGKGSILSYLKSKVWALSLYSGNDETGFEHNSTYAAFSVTVGLTEDGLDHLFDVITVIFQYIEMLRQHGPNARIYEEIQSIEQNVFRWQEENSAADYVENLCENMQFYPPQDYICGDQLMFKFDSEIISEVQNALVPDRCNIIVMSHRFEKEKSEKKHETWFQTPYFESEIDQNWLQSWKNIELNPNLHLPEVNRFIATDFSVRTPDVSQSEYPVKIIENVQSRLWYRKDDKFNIPKAYVNFHLITPVVNSSPRNLALLDIFVSILVQNLMEAAYPAAVSQLFYNVYGAETGLVIQVHGFNEKLHILLETILDFIEQFTIKEELFEAVKNHLIKEYFNSFIKPSKLCTEVRLSLLQQFHWTPVDKRIAIADATPEMLKSFIKDFKSHLFIEGLVQGNLTKADSLRLLSLVQAKLNCKPILNHLMPEIRVLQLEKGERFCTVATFNADDSNSVITNYYQSGVGDIHKTCLMELLITLMEEPCFDILRTQQQLGYNVYCMFRNTFGIIGFSVTVHTQADKYSCDQADQRIEEFLASFLKTLENETTEKEFQTQVSSLIRLKECIDLRLRDEVNRNWTEIMSGSYLFNRLQLEIEHLKKITLDELKSWYKDHLSTGNKFFKLGVQIVGNHPKGTGVLLERKRHSSPHNLIHCTEKPNRTYSRGEVNKSLIKQSEINTDDERTIVYELQFMKKEDSSKDASAYICDVRTYKQGRGIFPVVKIVN